MKLNHILSVVLTVLTIGICRADLQTDKLINKISRDTETYISAECRAGTQKEAYENALADLNRQVAAYMRENNGTPTNTSSSELSNHYQHLDSQISDNRYRVFMYVKKNDLVCFQDSSSNIAFSSKTDDLVGEAITWGQRKAMLSKEEGIPRKEAGVSWPAVISELAGIKEKEKLVAALTLMRKNQKITGAAAFPVADFEDFYLAIINGDRVTHIIHVLNGKWTDAFSGKVLNPADLSSASSAYWFTLPK